MKTFTKDPQGVLDYVWDWSPWLGTDTITEYSFIIPTDFTKVDDSESDGKVTLWLSGGVAKKTYVITCHIKTQGTREEDRSVIFNLEDR